MRTLIPFLFALAAGCEVYDGPAPAAAELDPVEQCYELAAAFCEGASACGHSSADPTGCVEYIAVGRCDANRTVIPPDVLVARAADLRAIACAADPTEAELVLGQAAGAVLWAMLQW